MKTLGLQQDPFKTALEKYGVFPTTVWKCDHSDRVKQQLSKMIGDGGQERAGATAKPRGGTPNYKGYEIKGFGQSARKDCFTKETDDKSVYRGVVTESIFNPILAIWILNLFGPQEGVVFDPFAGGGTRAIVTAKKNLEYIGTELRKEEVEAVNARLEMNGVKATILVADAKEVPVRDNIADFLLTCPPYHNLEMYDGGPNDLSMCGTYDDFLVGMGRVIAETSRILKSGALACWVVGLHRDPSGTLLPLHHDIARIHKKRGFALREEIILYSTGNPAISRVGNFDKGRRLLVRQHEYCLVFRKL